MTGHTLKIQCIGGRRLAPDGKKVDAFVLIEVNGVLAQTHTVKGHGNVQWNEVLNFRIRDPRASVVRFFIYDDGLLGQKCLGTHVTTIGHLFKGKVDQNKVQLSGGISGATFTYSLLAKGFGLDMPEPQLLDAAHADPEPWVCFSCDATNAPEAKFCIMCGTGKGVATITRPDPAGLLPVAKPRPPQQAAGKSPGANRAGHAEQPAHRAVNTGARRQ